MNNNEKIEKDLNNPELNNEELLNQEDSIAEQNAEKDVDITNLNNSSEPSNVNEAIEEDETSKAMSQRDEEEKVVSEQIKNSAKTLSPSQIVLKRFFKSKLSILGLIMIVFLFLFSFLGPVFSPYGEIEADNGGGEISVIPTKIDFKVIKSDEATVSNLSNEYIYTNLNDVDYFVTAFEMTINAKAGSVFDIYLYGERYEHVCFTSSYTFATDKTENIILDLSSLSNIEKVSLSSVAVKANSNDEFTIKHYGFSVDTLSEGYNAVSKDTTFTFLTGDATWKTSNDEEVTITKGEVLDHFIYDVTFSPTQINVLSYPSKKHWLGTDKDGYDILTRLMYGGRISLKIGFLVVFLETFIGIIFGSLAGYFGKWVDMVIMRIVDIFYCVPTLPILLIASKVIEENNVDEGVRIYFLMGFLCLFGWAGTARLVRGQILALREQEYMTAAKALGLSTWTQIFRHLIPNVMPQLIVTMTLGLGSVILTESTLSFLGLGVPIPYAAWGSMISGLQTTEILSEHFHLWGPPGFCIVLAVLGFNFIGDGLRDAFDPKSKR